MMRTGSVGAVNLDVLVIGAGVSGLTTAIRLAEAGLRTEIWTADPAAATTSYVAGALWGPYLAAPVDRVAAWSARSLAVFGELASDPDSGVRLVAGVEASIDPAEPPAWRHGLDGFRLCRPDELPDGFAAGWRFAAPLVTMPVHLGYLERRFAAAGGTIRIHRIATLGEAVTAAPVVVNCAGIGARELVDDASLVPIRGQLVVVENPGITEFFVADVGGSPDLVYFFPHGDLMVLGGTAEEGDWDREPSPAVAAGIIARCAAIDPRIGAARVVEHRVGLRPARPTVRVETDKVDGVRVIHNYGHGGGGVTLSWGCAEEVVGLLAT
jgi:D-amino-acid oxidase